MYMFPFPVSSSLHLGKTGIDSIGPKMWRPLVLASVFSSLWRKSIFLDLCWDDPPRAFGKGTHRTSLFLAASEIKLNERGLHSG